MWTLTFTSPQFEWAVVVRETGRFLDRLAYVLRRAGIVRPGTRMPYLYVLEVHPDGHGLHVHLLVDRWIPHALLSRVWGKGWVFASRRRGSRREQARALADYVTKDFDRSRESLREAGVVISDRARRFSVAKGFVLRVVRSVRQTLHEARDWLMGEAGEDRLLHEASSADIPQWRGPPWVWMQWR